MARSLQSLKLNRLRVVLPLLLIFFLLISSNQALALTQTRDYAASTATVKTPSVTLAIGNQGTSSLSATSDYAYATITAGLTFNENANAVVSTLLAPSKDGSVFKGGNAVSSAATPNLNTGNANDIIYVVISILGSNAVSSITNSGTALTWNKRAAVNDGTNERVEAWYAISSARFTGQTITVSFGGSTTFTIIAFGITGANTASPFDVNPAIPATGTGSSTTQSVTVSTSNPNDYLIGEIAVKPASGNAPNPTAGTGFTSIQSNHQGSVGGAAESESVTTAQSSTVVSFSTGATSITWAMIGDAVKGNLPSATVNTDFSLPTSTGSFSITNGQSAFLWSPVYPSATTVYSRSWMIDLWASATASAVMQVLFVAVDSSNAITALAASGATGTITTSKSEVKTTFSGSQISVPSGGRLLAIITNLAGSAATFTIYWGTGQVTNYQTPSSYDYVLKIVNSAPASYSVSLSTSSSSSISRLTNLTVFIYSPSTYEIIIINGAFTLSSGPTVTLPSSSTLYIAVVATANAFGTSNIVLSMKFAPSTKPFACDVINLTVN